MLHQVAPPADETYASIDDEDEDGEDDVQGTCARMRVCMCVYMCVHKCARSVY